MKWLKEEEIVSEDGTQHIVKFETLYITEDIRLRRRTDIDTETLCVEKLIDGIWEIVADAYDLKLKKLR